ncbi:hypothetical protein BGZ54_003460, partial [Gamsiella multidivaricata]
MPATGALHCISEEENAADASSRTTPPPPLPPSSSTSVFEPLREGGLRGWLAVLGSLLIHCFVFAPTEFVFGVFVLHYQEVFPNSPASAIAFVGTTGSAITYIAGFLSGIVADRFGYRRTAFIGSVVMAVSLGGLFGVGASLAYYPAIAVPSQYFVKNRGLAIGIAVSGTGLGGFALAPLTNMLIDKVDIFWTLRILGMMIFVVCGGASMLIVEKKTDLQQEQDARDREDEETKRDQERTITVDGAKDFEARSTRERPSFFQSLHVFKDPRFLSLTLAELAASIGYLIPLYYMQTYAVYIGLTPDQGALILGLANGSSFIGRILLGVIADRVSNTKTLLFCCWATAFSVMVLWTIAKSFGMLVLMGMTFCMFAGAYVSLVPVAVAESFGTDSMASMIGLMYGAGGVAMWGGSPLAGYILDSTLPNLSYTPVIMTAGGSMILGAIYEILIAACKDDNLDMLEQILSADSSSFDINHTDELGNSALHYAARYGSTGCLEILLYYDGIKVNAINSDEGDTPLHKAAGYQDVESALDMVQILIRGGASPK